MLTDHRIDGPVAEADRGRTRLVSLGACCILLIAFAAMWFPRLDYHFEHDYNEGVYVCSARLAMHGYPLFSEVFSSQPPAFLEILTIAFYLFGDTVVVGRAVIVVFSLLSLAATAWIAWRLIAPVAAPAAIVALALPLIIFHQVRTVQAEMPSLAFSLLAIGVLTSCPSRPRSPWLVIAGFLLALGGLCKLLVAPLVVPAGLLLIPSVAGQAPLHLGTLPGSLFSRHFLWRCLLFGLGGVLAIVLTMCPWDLEALYDQMITFHLKAKEPYATDWLANLEVIWQTLRDEPALVATSLGGLAYLVWQHPGAALWLVSWLGASCLFLVTHNPLFPRHALIAFPALALAASAAVLWVPWLWRFAWGPPVVLTLALPLCGSVGLAIQRDLAALVKPGRYAPEPEYEMVRFIEAHTAPADFVVSDQQMQIFRAGRLTPPAMCDTAHVRIKAGYLTDEQAIRASQDAKVVIFWTGRLVKLPDFQRWVEANFVRVPTLYDGKMIYLRK